GLSPVSPQGTQWGGSTNNYHASVGTSTNYFSNANVLYPPQDTTGVFTQGGRSYGVQNITDGTSNTIAFGEALVGAWNMEQVKWRDGPVLTTPSAVCQGGWCGVYDISANYTG